MNFQSLIEAITAIAGKSTLGLILSGSIIVFLAIIYIIFKIKSKPTQSQTNEQGTGSVIDEQNQANNDIENSQEHFKHEKNPK